MDTPNNWGWAETCQHSLIHSHIGRHPLDLLLPVAETAVLAGALKDEGFTIVATCPGWVETDMGTRSSKEMDVRCFARLLISY